MATYGYIRTSRDQEPGHSGSDPHVQRRQLVEAGVDPARIYADVAASGAKDYNSRDQWHVLDQQLVPGRRSGRCRHRPPGTALPRDHVGDLRPAAPRHPAAVPGRRPRLPRGLHGQRPGQHGGLCGQPGAAEHQPQDQGGPRRRQGEGRGAGPAEASHQRTSSSPSGRTWRKECPWRRWRGNMGWPGPRSAAPWAGRSQADQADAIRSSKPGCATYFHYDKLNFRSDQRRRPAPQCNLCCSSPRAIAS